MIDLDKKVIFIHVAKTGGCSVEYSFGIRQDFSNCYWADDYRHFGPIKYEQYFDVSEFYRFTIIRNPFDRYASWCFNYFKKRMKDKLKKSGLPLKIALDGGEILTDKEVRKHGGIIAKYNDPQFVRQHFFAWLQKRDEKLNLRLGSSEAAKRGWLTLWWQGVDYVNWFDDILRTETLSSDYQKIRDRFDVQPLEVRNASVQRNADTSTEVMENNGDAPRQSGWSWMYDARTLEFLESRVRADLDKFGYEAPLITEPQP